MSLFKGKDLAGWTTKQLHNHDWSVVDGVIDCNPQGEVKGDRELWTTKEYADFELWVDWRIKESPYVNKKARIILPDGSYQKDDSGWPGHAASHVSFFPAQPFSVRHFCPLFLPECY